LTHAVQWLDMQARTPRCPARAKGSRLPLAVIALLLLGGCAGNGGTSTEGIGVPLTNTTTPSVTLTPTQSVTPTPVATATETMTATTVPSATPSATPSTTATATPSASPSITATPTASATPTPDCEAQGVICTVAGTGMSIFDGDGRPALQTSFYFPLDVEFDTAGRALIVDWNNLRIRRLELDGTISTYMGLDYEDFPVEGGLAKDSPLHHASDIELDVDGRLYVAGDHVPVVFRVGTDDRVHTVAGTDRYGYDGDGGPALEAKLMVPFGVLPAADGEFYISDADAHVVRYVDADGIITTVAGTGAQGYRGDGGPATAAQLAGPSRLRLDAEGNLYICETKNHVVRRLDRDGTITTFAGTGTRGFSGDGGRATDAQLDSPYDVRFAPNGDAYVADTGNHRIRRIDASGVITTVVGTGQRGFAGDGGDAATCQLNRPASVIFDRQGNLWLADAYNHRVRRVARFLSPRR
jgi:sugar lactone lactonase YvrE